MNGIISKILFPTASRAVNTRNIFTKKYLGLAFTEGKEKEAHAKAGRNITKIKDNFLESYKTKGIKHLRINDIKNFVHFVKSEKDMDNLSRVHIGLLCVNPCEVDLQKTFRYPTL